MAVSVRKVSLPDLYSADNAQPELRDAVYLTEVLQLSAESTEAYFHNLIMKANAMGITVSRPSSAASATNKRNTTGADSNATVDTGHTHTRTASTGSDSSTSTAPTSHCSADTHHDFAGKLLPRRRSRGLSFTQYERYLAQINPNLGQPKFLLFPRTAAKATPSIFSASTKKSYISLKRGFSKIRRKRRILPSPEAIPISCSACREDIQPEEILEKLPCGHSYCPTCLRIMINQAVTEESKMPPRCCTQPIPSSIIKSVLSREEQNRFLKAVLQYSTPWESRVFCSNPSCGEFIPPRAKVDPKYPFQATCRKCRTRVCVMCKRDAHPIGQDCPDDWELEAVLKMGEKSGWRRCYKCRTLVELNQGCTHMTCRCRAQFCYICGAVWDPSVGCPNFCNGDAELERRRQEEEERVAALEAEEARKQEAAEKEAVERQEAEERTKNSKEFWALREEQANELGRFLTFERKTKLLMWTRHSQQKLSLVEKHTGAIDKMKERHAKTSANLEDRQVAAEMELRTTLEQSERNVRIRLKHMEAYCDGLGQNPNSDLPARVVTERDLRELGQQYNLEKNMKQLHQAKINVMRDRQTKALEDLLERQEAEMNKLIEKNAKEMESLETEFADEEDVLAATFSRRKAVREKCWKLEMEIMQNELEKEKGVRYAPMAPIEWPQQKELLEDSLSAVEE